jgi:alkylation response protein AidB-like acyl-CoA dehydrogenase
VGGMPEIRQLFMSADQIEILDTWDVAGLRGTGSTDFQAKDVFVPEHRMFRFDVPSVDAPLYRCTWVGITAALLGAVPLGIARRAIDEFTALSRAKTPTYDPRAFADSPRVHAWIGEAEAMVRSARAFLFEALEASWQHAQSAPVTLPLRRDVRLAAANAVAQSAKAVDLVYTAGGGSAIHSSHPLQRCFRDVHVATQHFMMNSTIFEYAGRVFLREDGAEPPLF